MVYSSYPLRFLENLCGRAEHPLAKVSDKVKDKFVSADYDIQDASLLGYIGERMRINIEKRLLTFNLPSILEPYIHRPGKQTWIGEHAGKFLHAATYAWEYTGNARLKQKMDSVAKVLIATQQPNGYLGTYLERDRWTDWDVWSHKYNLIGLLTYYSATGDAPALESCKKIGDLLISTFQKGNKDIIKAGWHVGMAATSVLEPIVLLYRYTGDKRYLSFCEHIVQSWEEPNGPKILTSLLQKGNVYKTANGKAYEMLSNLVGLIDLYRMTGEANYLKACTNAWNDIMTYRHYPTGTTSWGEHFQNDFVLRPDGEVYGDKYEGAGEGCVTVTWLQLNLHLLRLTGEQRYANELERITYNGLVGAQSPQNGSVCYFIPLTGRKRFGEVNHGILPDVSCCASSIPRGISLIPQFIAGTLNNNEAVIWQYITGHYPVAIKKGKEEIPVDTAVHTSFPEEGTATLTIHLSKKDKAAFPLSLRVPEWCTQYTATIAGQHFTGRKDQLLMIDRTWNNGDEIQITMSMDMQVLQDKNRGSDKVVVQRGPQVLALDDILDTRSSLPQGWVGDQFYQLKGKINGQEKIYKMVPFADAGQTMGHYQVLIDKVEGLTTPSSSPQVEREQRPPPNLPR